MKVAEIINSSIVEIYEREQPELCAIIHALVRKGEKLSRFKQMIKRSIPDWKTSMTYSASLTLFKHYQTPLIP